MVVFTSLRLQWKDWTKECDQAPYWPFSKKEAAKTSKKSTSGCR